MQLAPQAHARVAAATEGVAESWQPQLQDEPGQAAQVQVLGWADMIGSPSVGEGTW